MSKADRDYEKWLTEPSQVRVPIDRAMVKRLFARAKLVAAVTPREGFKRGAGVSTTAAKITGLAPGTIRSLLHESTSSVTIEEMERIAETLGERVNFLALANEHLPLGVEGWGPSSDWCDCCGTFFHEHYRDDLCHECYVIRETGEGAPRDVRLAKPRVVVDREPALV